MKKGRLFVVSGPSGAGKSTLTKIVVKEMENTYLSVSATTRSPRTGEVNGKDYYFMSIEEFEKAVSEDKFLEHANVHGNYYGTLKSAVEEKLNEGKNVILEIDVQGGEMIKTKFNDAHLLFVAAPSAEELERRLRGRSTDSEEVIQRRLGNSLQEMKYKNKYDFVIINDNIDRALGEIKDIIIKEGNNK